MKEICDCFGDQMFERIIAKSFIAHARGRSIPLSVPNGSHRVGKVEMNEPLACFAPVSKRSTFIMGFASYLLSHLSTPSSPITCTWALRNAWPKFQVPRGASKRSDAVFFGKRVIDMCIVGGRNYKWDGNTNCTCHTAPGPIRNEIF